MENKKTKKKYEAPKAEEVELVHKDTKFIKVSQEELNLMQEALNTATKTINDLNEKSKSNYEKYIRSLADYQNLKRISDIKISSAKDSGKISVFKDLLPVMDNFEKAVSSGEVTEGVELIYNCLKSVFTSNNVEIISPKQGDIFDDSIHEAIASVPGNEEIKNTIAFVQYNGYKLGDSIIRYAKVGVYV